MHYQGDLDGQGPVWGYVEGGMGMSSFAIADAAAEAGRRARLRRTGRRDHPGGGRDARGRDRDPRRDRDLQRRPEAARSGCSPPTRSTPTSATGSRSGRSAARWSSSTPRSSGCRTGRPRPARRGPRRRRSTSPARWPRRRRRSSAATAGEPAVAFGEIYIQTGYDPSPAPAGKHLMSVFGQYAPYDIADGDWESARDGVADQFIDLIVALRARLRRVPARPRGPRPARHRVADRAHRRQHLPGRGDPRSDVGGAPLARARRSTASTSAAPQPTPPAA